MEILQHPGDAAAAQRSIQSTAKPCDYCRAADAVVFCCDESAYMCLSCDARAHLVGGETGGSNSKHGRIWVCEVCEQEPAAVTCKADAAALCEACDRDIHSANHLARKHERTPVAQFYGSAEAEAAKLATNALLVQVGGVADDDIFAVGLDCCEKKLDSWIQGGELPETDGLDVKLIDFLFSEAEADGDIDFDSFQLCPQPYESGDSLVINFEADFSNPDFSSYSHSGAGACSFARTLSNSVITDGSSVSVPEISPHFPATICSISVIDQIGKHAVANDRAARVLRYLEKRKNRNFKKTVRYASRKAYAETRPRVKGRFTKRTDTD